MVSIADLAKFADDLVKEKSNLEQEYLGIKEKSAKKEKELQDFEIILKNREKKLEEIRNNLDKDIQSIEKTKEIIEGIKIDAMNTYNKGIKDIEDAKYIRTETTKLEIQLKSRADQLQRQEIELIRRSKDIQMKENNFILLTEKKCQ